MVKAVTKYEACDGTLFDTQQDAQDYEAEVLLTSTLADFIYDSVSLGEFYHSDAFSLAQDLLKVFNIERRGE